MVTSISHSYDNPIGAVFTPLKWARYCATRFGIVQEWLKGASVCDPTAGDGAFMFALCDEARAAGSALSRDLISKLVVCEKNQEFVSRFKERFAQRYGIPFEDKNLHVCDIVMNPPRIETDYMIGNPPWANFPDLPAHYKKALKPYFLAANLVDRPQDLLLGAARIDLAALVVSTAMARILKRHGKAVFFLPLSLFQNAGAHSGFRRYLLPDGSHYAVREVLDFNGERIFAGISTRFGVALFERDATTEYPLPYYVYDRGNWSEQRATPYPTATSPLTVHDGINSPKDILGEDRIVLRTDQKPRQGVNTCGANSIFIFETEPAFIPKELIYPLASKECFRAADGISKPWKFVFLPYNANSGKPLDEHVLRTRFPSAWDYLQGHRRRLEERKGTLIGSWKKRGYWWALLGVGPYSFAPYKVIWEAYGARSFNPVIFAPYHRQPYQGNQAMHAYIPCRSRSEAECVKAMLRQSGIENFLAASRTEGTCNWAQPGRVKQIMRFTDPQLDLFAGAVQ